MSAIKQVIAINENEATRPEGTQAGSVPVPAEIGGTSPELMRPLRRRLPDERRAITHHFSIAGQEGYLTVGVYDDGSPGEIFVRMAKEGSTISGLMDSIATVVSLALQHGVPLDASPTGSRFWWMKPGVRWWSPAFHPARPSLTPTSNWRVGFMHPS